MSTRFFSSAGDVIDRAIPGGCRLTLAEAHQLFGTWAREGIKADQAGNAPLARLYLRDAGDLHRAIYEAERWARCAGWRAPREADGRVA